jgi:hypothetical protein
MQQIFMIAYVPIKTTTTNLINKKFETSVPDTEFP